MLHKAKLVLELIWLATVWKLFTLKVVSKCQYCQLLVFRKNSFVESLTAEMFNALLQAGGNVNNPGNDKCGKYPIDHAIQHQRLDSVQVSEMSVRVGMRAQWLIYKVY